MVYTPQVCPPLYYGSPCSLLLAPFSSSFIWQEILDTTIKHSPGTMANAAVERRRSNFGRAVEATTTVVALDRSVHPSTDPASKESAGSTGVEGDEDGEGGEAAAAHAAAVAAAAEELAAAESHSLTQGAMKLVYLLAIQVGERAGARDRTE